MNSKYQECCSVKEWRPNLFIVGAAKSGTTSLAELLGSEPDVYLPVIKEPFYFIDNYGVKDIDDYRELYRTDCNIRIDASTGYLFSPQCPTRIKEFSAEANIIILLRNPIDFVVSYWEYMRANGRESMSLSEAISDKETKYRKSEEFIKNCEQWPGNYLYKERGLFFNQVKNYMEIFPKNRIKVLLFEDLIAGNQIEEIYRFIGLPIRQDLKLPKVNVSGKPNGLIKWLRFSPSLRFIKSIVFKVIPKNSRYRLRKLIERKSMSKSGYDKYILTNEERSNLKSFFEQDVVELKNLLRDVDFSVWKDFNK